LGGDDSFLIFSPGLLNSIENATLEANISALYTGIFSAAIAYVTWATALSLGRASTVTSMLYVEPVIHIITAWIWLKEWPSTLSLIGGLIAISGVIIVNGIGRKHPRLIKKAA
jgi:drug/metabolite transporter (DMT)-like permease